MTLAAQHLISQAQAATGLADWGNYDFTANLDTLLGAIGRTASLSPLGEQRMGRRIVTLLENHLSLVQARRAAPAIADQKITRPIFILGLPRSGTSNLLTLLSRDPAHRAPRMWEMLRPCPAPQPEPAQSEACMAQAQELLLHGGFDSKELNAAHPFDARLPDECGFIFEHSFAAMPYAAYMHLPDYIDFSVNQADWKAIYGFHRQFLQHLQAGMPGQRWVLKTPEHNLHIPQLLAAYPDAILLNTVRDPAKVLPSLASNFVSLRKLFAEPASIDKLDSAAAVQANIQTSVERMMAVRQDPAVERHFYDIDFTDLTERPLDTMRKLYRHVELPFSAEAEAGITHYVEHDAKKLHGHGGHAYTLEEFGYDAGKIDAMLAPYMQRFKLAGARMR